MNTQEHVKDSFNIGLDLVKVDDRTYDDDNNSEKSNATYVYENKYEFYLIIIGYVIGFGSFWRLPYLIFSNGGSAFLLAFIITMCLICIPLFYAEVFLGQIFSKGPVETFSNLSNKFKGVGITSLFTTWLLSCYYGMVLTWVFYYFFCSFITPLPWVKDNNQINFNYFKNDVLNMTDNIDNVGSFNFSLFICLIVTYLSVFYCIRQGILSSSKIVYVTAPAPVIIMFILLIK